jgi:hypothetical protein
MDPTLENPQLVRKGLSQCAEYQVLMIDKEFVDWIDTKNNKTKDKVRHLNLIAQFLFCIVLLISICIVTYVEKPDYS